MSYSDTYNVIPALTTAANEFGVSPDLVVALAEEESGLDPNAKGDRGYYSGGVFHPDPGSPPSSFGLGQFHEGGYALPSPSGTEPYTPPGWVFDPTAAGRAIAAHLAATMKRYPDVKDPGMIAAISQGPADKAGYARAIDSLLGQGGHVIYTPSSPAITSSGASAAGVASDVSLTSVLSGLNPVTAIAGALKEAAIRLLELVVGAALLFIGVRGLGRTLLPATGALVR